MVTSKEPAVKMVYRSDASMITGECEGVFFPETEKELIEFVKNCYDKNIKITPRGAGTGLCGGATPTKTIIVDLSKMNKFQIEEDKRTGELFVIAEPGVVLDEINNKLRNFGLVFPVIPSSHKVCTIGGMASTNAVGLRGLRDGRVSDWVEEVTFIDGTGTKHTTKEKFIFGSEGILGIITKVKMKTAKFYEETSLDKFEFDNPKELVEKVKKIKDNKNITLTEYINPLACEIVRSARGYELGTGEVLIIGYNDDSGSIKGDDVKKLIKLRESVPGILGSEGYTRTDDPEVPLENMAEFLKWLNDNKIPAVGHIGIGIIHPRIKIEGADKLTEKMYEVVKQLGGSIYGEHGIGIKKARYMSKEEKERWKKLKKRYDSKGIMNPGKIV